MPEFREAGRHLVATGVGLDVDGRIIAWEEVGAFGILENASRKGSIMTQSGPMATQVTGCLAVCVIGDVDVVPAFGVLLDCVRNTPSPAERDKAIAFLRRELGDLWDRVPQFAPPNVQVEDWWREQVYGNGSHAHTDHERIEELRAALKRMNDDLA